MSDAVRIRVSPALARGDSIRGSFCNASFSVARLQDALEGPGSRQSQMEAHVTSSLGIFSVSTMHTLDTLEEFWPVTSQFLQPLRHTPHATQIHEPIHSEVSTSTSTRRPVQIPYPAPTHDPPALKCGVKEYLKQGPGFSLCQGRNAIAAFCSLDLDQYAGPAVGRPDLTISPIYFDQSAYSGILISREGFLPADECDYSHEPKPRACGPTCEAKCFSILTSIMNDCQTDTTDWKMGGYRVVGCQQWGIFSVLNSTGHHNWKIPDYNTQLFEVCPAPP